MTTAISSMRTFSSALAPPNVLLGMSASHAVKRWNLSANVLAAVATEGEFGATRHQFGDSINYDVTAKYRLWPMEVGSAPGQWFVSFGLNGEWRGLEHKAKSSRRGQRWTCVVSHARVASGDWQQVGTRGLFSTSRAA